MARIILALMLSAGAEALGGATLPPADASCKTLASLALSGASCATSGETCGGTGLDALGVCVATDNAGATAYACLCCPGIGGLMTFVLPSPLGGGSVSLDVPACPDR